MPLTRQRVRSYHNTPLQNGGPVNRADNFNRADSPSLGTPSDGGSAWTDRFGSFAIVGNQAVADAMQGAGQPWAADNSVALSTLTCSANGTVSFMFPLQSGNQGIAFRYSDVNNMWVAFLSGNYLFVDKVAGGVKTSVVNTQLSQNYPLGSGVILRVVLTSGGFTVQTTMGGVTQQEGDPIADTFNNGAIEHGPYATNATAPFENFSFVGA
jgi:hypothetical protein